MSFSSQFPGVMAVSLMATVWIGSLPLTALAGWNDVVDESSFQNTNVFQSKWSYNYPYGQVHNGASRMNQTNVTVSGGVVTLTSSLATGYEGTNEEGDLIHYNSGTFYLAQPITISKTYPIWDISGQFKLPTVAGTWPAMWLDGVNSWPPESDILEFKGNSNCWQNTYDGTWLTQITPVPTANGNWHTYRVVAVLENSTNVDFHYYIDGTMEGEQTKSTFVGSPCWLIIDYEMEGASGTTAPNYTTYVYVSNIVIKCESVSAATGPVADGVYKLISQSTGNGLEVSNQNTSAGSLLGQSPYHGALNGQWTMTYLGNSQYNILGRQSGRALGISNASINNGADVDIEDYTDGLGQKWQLNAVAGGAYELINANSKMALEVADNSPVSSAVIDQWSAADVTPPQLSAGSLAGTNFILSGVSGVPGVGYAVIGSTDLTMAPSNWPAITNIICSTNGNFSYTNGDLTSTPSQFYQIKLPSNTSASNQQWTFQAP
ncbi:MAG TPA: RICIN domain-containing protein [Verrucomicrobiae bacterium]